MAEGLSQITIPEFDDDDFSSPIPFGRSTNAFGFGSSSGADSPTLLTPVQGQERFGGDHDFFHSRQDSAASEDSTFSIHAPSSSFAARSNSSIPTAHSSQTSLPTSTTPFAKKSSFASLRNAFKSGAKSSEAPPVPALDKQNYPALRNPFSRSATSLANSSLVRSPPSSQGRPSTPSSNYDNRHGRAVSMKTRGHVYGRSQHSQSGSIYHNSDAGSDYSFGFHHIIPRQTTPPPVPRFPNEVGGIAARLGTPETEDKVAMDPRTPSEYALHAIFMRFAALAEDKIETFIKQSLDRDPSLSDFFGAQIDPKFDDNIDSLGHLAMRNAKPVIDSIMRWRKSQLESVSMDIVTHHTSGSSYARSLRTKDIVNILNERKSLASIYIMCRALISVVQAVPRDVLGESMAFNLEESTFEQFKKPDLKLLAQSRNQRTNADLYAVLLGALSNIRFESVTDRFLHELGPVALNQIPKDMDVKYENLVRALKYIEIKVWPPEAFEEGADFMESLSKSFENAHGSRLKIAFAETLLSILHPIGKTAQAEVNHPGWAKAMEVIYLKAREMMSKPRYWQVAYPLVVTSLCVAPQEFFLKHWMSCFEGGLPKLKERPYRVIVMNGIMRLVWTYLYRCREPNATSTTKLDALLKHFFPPSRLNIYPSDDVLDHLVYMIHFILSRHVDFGVELVLSLMQEQQVKSAQSGATSIALAPERISIALEATLRSLYLWEREEPMPTWPTSNNFSALPDRDDYPFVSSFCPQSILLKPGMEDFFDRCGQTLVSVTLACAKSVGKMSIFDEQWAYSRQNGNYEDPSGLNIRQHPEVTVAYPSSYTSQMNVLTACFSSWPRCLHPSLPIDEALDILIRAIIHVEPSVCEAASGALRGIAEDPVHLPRVLSRFASFLFSPKQFATDTSGTRLPFESLRLLNVWFDIVDAWSVGIIDKSSTELGKDDTTWLNSQFFDVEIAALFLLGLRTQSARSIGVKLVRTLANIVAHFHKQPSTPFNEQSDTHILDVLLDRVRPRTHLEGFDDLLDTKETNRLAQWRQSTLGDVFLRLANSDDERDRRIWWFVYPTIIRSQANHRSKVIQSCREMWVDVTARYHSFVVSASGLGNRPAPTQNGRGPANVARERERQLAGNLTLIEQWHMWVKLICCTASPSESRGATQHSRAPSDAVPDRDLVSTNARGLFRYLLPFLDCEHAALREIAVFCISSFPVDAYRDLLEDLSALAGRYFYVDTNRVKMSPSSTFRRNRHQDRMYLGVAHIYQLTSHYLKDQRGLGRQDSLTNVLKFVRHTQAFLSSPEIRGDWQQQRLRRYFCGIVEKLFDGLSNLQSSDRFIPANTHLTLYRLCEEWCQCGSQSERVKHRLIEMQTAATVGFPDPQLKAGAITQFQTETRLLSHAAAAAMASLVQKALYPPDLSSGSPTDRLSSDFLVPLEVAPTLDRLVAMLANMHDPVKACGRKALRSLVEHKGKEDSSLCDELLRRSFVTCTDPATSSYRFFEVVADSICSGEATQLTFGHVVCIGLANLCSPLVNTRRLALAALEAANKKANGPTSLLCFEAGVESSAASVYLDAMFQISHLLSQEHHSEAINVIIHCASKLIMVHDALTPYTFSQILTGLSPWFGSVDLLVMDNSSLTREGRVILFHLLSLTLRYSETYPEQIHALWKRLVDNNHPNGHATIRFLLEQSSKNGSSSFVSCARKVIACLSRTSCGRQTYEELCDVIEPARMLPTMEPKSIQLEVEEPELWFDLDALFSEQPKHSLGSAQFALLFLGDVALPRSWDFQKQLPVILQGVFSHVGHRNPFVREQTRQMLFQILRSWLPGYAELPNGQSYTSMKAHLLELEKDSNGMFWTEDDNVSLIDEKMRTLCTLVLQWLGPLHPELADEWGTLALIWGTTCSIRPIAFRSLQVFRSLMPKITQADLAQLLGRLSNTVAGVQEPNLHPFTVELIITLSSVAKSGNADRALLPQLFWCAVSCLSTPVEAEFLQLLDLLDCLLDKLDLNDPYVVEVLIANKPENLSGEFGLQPLLLVGLRSSKTYERTFMILNRLSAVDDSTLIDPSGMRVRDMYTLILPWCLRSMEENVVDEVVIDYATSIARFAEQEDKGNIARIMTSFAKSRFRTKDDFMRQAAAALREYYAPDHWTNVVSLLMSLVLNQDRWLQIKSMQFLKVLFQLRETRSPVDKLGSELLMPLLRLLQTELAPQALEVLEEPMTISGGLSAKHVLRMSMHLSSIRQHDTEVVTEVFGIPEDSGWSVARPERQRDISRTNVMAVFDTCKVPTRPSRIEFEPEVDRFADPLDSDLGDLVQNLHELSTFFLGDADTDDDVHVSPQPTSLPLSRMHAQVPPMTVPNQKLEARIAAILAKSTDVTSNIQDSPQTPFVDVFHVKPPSGVVNDVFDGSDEDSDSSEFDIDSFAFDSFANSSDGGHPIQQNGINGLNGFKFRH